MNNIDKAYLNIINRKNIISENHTFDNVYDEFSDAADSFTQSFLYKCLHCLLILY